ncbi:hypothetical protein SNEBB_005635 [Seison nebaliae]|nr:hypothetical protein SNEBB_005635 [Seison nebaliae]
MRYQTLQPLIERLTRRLDEPYADELACYHLGDGILFGINCLSGSTTFAIISVLVTKVAGPASFIGVILATFHALLNASCIAELTSCIERGGSTYTIVYTVLGEFFAFLLGWSMFISLIGLSAVTAQSMSFTIDAIINGRYQLWARTSMRLWTLSAKNANPPMAIFPDLMAGFFIFIIFIILYRTNFGWSIANGTISLIYMIFIFGLVTVGFAIADYGNISYNGGMVPLGFSSILHATVVASYMYVGIDFIPLIHNQMVDSTRDTPRAIMYSVFIVGMFNVLLTFLVPLIAPWFLLNPHGAYQSALQLAQKADWGQFMVNLAPLFALAASLPAFMFCQAKLSYMMANDGLLAQTFYRVDVRTNVATNAVFFTSVFTWFLAVFFDVQQLIGFVNISSYVGYTIVCVSLIMSRIHAMDTGQFCMCRPKRISKKSTDNKKLDTKPPKIKKIREPKEPKERQEKKEKKKEAESPSKNNNSLSGGSDGATVGLILPKAAGSVTVIKKRPRKKRHKKKDGSSTSISSKQSQEGGESKKEYKSSNKATVPQLGKYGASGKIKKPKKKRKGKRTSQSSSRSSSNSLALPSGKRKKRNRRKPKKGKKPAKKGKKLAKSANQSNSEGLQLKSRRFWSYDSYSVNKSSISDHSKNKNESNKKKNNENEKILKYRGARSWGSKFQIRKSVIKSNSSISTTYKEKIKQKRERKKSHDDEKEKLFQEILSLSGEKGKSQTGKTDKQSSLQKASISTSVTILQNNDSSKCRSRHGGKTLKTVQKSLNNQRNRNLKNKDTRKSHKHHLYGYFHNNRNQNRHVLEDNSKTRRSSTVSHKTNNKKMQQKIESNYGKLRSQSKSLAKTFREANSSEQIFEQTGSRFEIQRNRRIDHQQSHRNKSDTSSPLLVSKRVPHKKRKKNEISNEISIPSETFNTVYRSIDNKFQVRRSGNCVAVPEMGLSKFPEDKSKSPKNERLTKNFNVKDVQIKSESKQGEIGVSNSARKEHKIIVDKFDHLNCLSDIRNEKTKNHSKLRKVSGSSNAAIKAIEKRNRKIKNKRYLEKRKNVVGKWLENKYIANANSNITNITDKIKDERTCKYSTTASNYTSKENDPEVCSLNNYYEMDNIASGFASLEECTSTISLNNDDKSKMNVTDIRSNLCHDLEKMILPHVQNNNNNNQNTESLIKKRKDNKYPDLLNENIRDTNLLIPMTDNNPINKALYDTNEINLKDNFTCVDKGVCEGEITHSGIILPLFPENKNQSHNHLNPNKNVNRPQNTSDSPFTYSKSGGKSSVYSFIPDCYGKEKVTHGPDCFYSRTFSKKYILIFILAYIGMLFFMLSPTLYYQRAQSSLGVVYTIAVTMFFLIIIAVISLFTSRFRSLCPTEKNDPFWNMFRVRLVPFVPLLAITLNIIFLSSCVASDWVGFLSVIIFGCMVYFMYSIRSSRLVNDPYIPVNTPLVRNDENKMAIDEFFSFFGRLFKDQGCGPKKGIPSLQTAHLLATKERSSVHDNFEEMRSQQSSPSPDFSSGGETEETVYETYEEQKTSSAEKYSKPSINNKKKDDEKKRSFLYDKIRKGTSTIMSQPSKEKKKGFFSFPWNTKKKQEEEKTKEDKVYTISEEIISTYTEEEPMKKKELVKAKEVQIKSIELKKPQKNDNSRTKNKMRSKINKLSNMVIKPKSKKPKKKSLKRPLTEKKVNKNSNNIDKYENSVKINNPTVFHKYPSDIINNYTQDKFFGSSNSTLNILDQFSKPKLRNIFSPGKHSDNQGHNLGYYEKIPTDDIAEIPVTQPELKVKGRMLNKKRISNRYVKDQLTRVYRKKNSDELLDEQKRLLLENEKRK